MATEVLPQVIVAKLDALQIALPGEPHFFVRECAALWLHGEGDHPHYFHGIEGAKHIFQWASRTCPDDYLILPPYAFFSRESVEMAAIEGDCVVISVAGIPRPWTFAATPDAVHAVREWQNEHTVLCRVPGGSHAAND